MSKVFIRFSIALGVSLSLFIVSINIETDNNGNNLNIKNLQFENQASAIEWVLCPGSGMRCTSYREWNSRP